MRTLLKTKIGPFLVISSVLAVWPFLAAQHVQAHKPDSPTCSGLPTAEDFFTGAETAPIAPGALTPRPRDKAGNGEHGKRRQYQISLRQNYRAPTCRRGTAGV